MTDQHPAAVAISNVTNAAQIAQMLSKHDECDVATIEENNDFSARIVALLADVPAVLTALRNESEAREEGRLSLQDELRGAQLEIGRLQRMLDRVTETNSKLMKEKADEQRAKELHVAKLAVLHESISDVFLDAVHAKNASAPSTRLYEPARPHSVTTLEHHEQPREAAGVAR